ncbi:MAG: hypothetical protein D3923_03255 [Candidatus Electrothrix sp. AR3]|nr:hypothetical protein [Candidatus Electrothrix sp. AR3]
MRCLEANKEGNIKKTEGDNQKSNITYINADELINKNSYLSGGGAHSDIYRPEHGKLIWNMLSKE